MAEREIKFRAWDKKESKMITSGVDFELICLSLPNPKKGYKHEGVMTPSPETYDRFDIMQFTGLHDKNGKEIYEGDIVKRQLDKELSSVVKVVWAGNGWHYKPAIPYEYGDLTEGYLEHSEVIGNIHENPKLLKEINGE